MHHWISPLKPYLYKAIKALNWYLFIIISRLIIVEHYILVIAILGIPCFYIGKPKHLI